jgi:hypothetical protein
MKKIVLIVFSIALCLGMFSVPVYALVDSGGTGGGSTKVEDPCKLHKSEFPELCNGGDEDDAKKMVGKILNVVYGLIGVVAVVFVIIGGFKYMTSQGEPGRVQQAKNTILYALIGLVITISAFAITAFILQALGAKE